MRMGEGGTYRETEEGLRAECPGGTQEPEPSATTSPLRRSQAAEKDANYRSAQSCSRGRQRVGQACTQEAISDLEVPSDRRSCKSPPLPVFSPGRMRYTGLPVMSLPEPSVNQDTTNHHPQTESEPRGSQPVEEAGTEKGS